ncbi:MAG: hypothetical protein JST00_25070 [Deltaproteobacteria bacterium]|nr:hypothetical protein [Deltaproteobacteria bacterium]
MPTLPQKTIDVLAAAADGSLSPVEAMQEVSDSMAAMGARISYWDAGRFAGQHSAGLSAACEADYVAHFAGQDPWAQGCATLPAESPRISDALIARRELERTDFYNLLCRPHKIRDLCGAVVSRVDGDAVIFGLIRGTDARGDGDREVSRIAGLMPHLKVLAAAERWRRMTVASSALDTVPFGVFVVDLADGAIVSTNASGLDLLDRGVVRQAAGRLVIDDEPLLLTTRSSESTPFVSARRAVRVVIFPTRTAGHDRFRTIHVHDDEAVARARTRRAVALFGLTPREANVAEGLLLREAPKEIAYRHGVSLATVRTQIRRLLEKTGSDRLSTLLMRLSEL